MRVYIHQPGSEGDTASPVVLAVRVSAPGKLQIEWSTGENLQTDISGYIDYAKQLQALRDADLFAKAAPSRDGRFVEWVDSIHISAGKLYALAKTPHGQANEDRQIRLIAAVERYRAGRIVSFELENTIGSLCTPDGAPLPSEVTGLLLELLHGKAKSRAGSGKSKTLIRESFRRRYEALRFDAALNGEIGPETAKPASHFLDGCRPTDKEAADKNSAEARYWAVVTELANVYSLAEYTIQTYIDGSHNRARSNYKPKKQKPK